MSVFRKFKEFAARGGVASLTTGAALGRIAAFFVNDIPTLPVSKLK